MSKYKIDACHFGDDWGSQHGLIMGLQCGENLLNQELQKCIEKFMKKDLLFQYIPAVI